MNSEYARAADERPEHLASILFYLVHVAALGIVVVTGVSWQGMAWALGMYYLRMFGLTAGYHRYFSHRSFRTSRPGQFVLALLGTVAVQKGVLWWAAHHRNHHRFSDTPRDIHSPRRGLWWSHAGWILCRKYNRTEVARVRDLARFPELDWLNRHHLLVVVLFAAGLYLVFGTTALLWGFFVSTVLLWHGTFTINSLAHTVGRRRYATGDSSRNSLVLALITLGEGWHNNHHYYQRSARQGFYWWEIDGSYYVLRALSLVGLVWELRGVPARVRASRPPAPATLAGGDLGQVAVPA